jgi:Leucine-rich repeat (LRR) protein
MATRRLTGDQNNISSKLLGANLADINIEKFRDLTNYKKNKYELEGKITIPILKTITNKFSPAVMFTIVLTNQAITKIDALAECENVVILNLSGNTIQDLTPLCKLTQLKIVDLSDNSISSVDCFEGF